MKCFRCGYNISTNGMQDGRCDECGTTIGNIPDVKLASLNERVLAQILDYLVAIAMFFGSILLARLLFVLFSIISRNVAESISLCVVYVGIFVGPSYILLADGLKGGQSYGKRLMKIAVITEGSGKPCSLMQSFGRNIVLSFLGVIDLISIGSGKRQRLGDVLAQTIVVKKNPLSQR